MQKLGPHHCDYCRLAMPPSETIWCSYCLALIKSVPRCQRCGLQTEHEAEQCGECLTDPPLWDRLFCIGNYTDPLKEYVNGLKYGQKFWYAHDLTSLLIPRISTPAPLLLPVPLHWKRRWWRSYNQSAMLAWALEKQLNARPNSTNVRCDIHTLQRIKATQPQQGLSRVERQKNLIAAFHIIKPIKEKHVAIIDDVVTTGATINLLCIELRKAGVEHIDVYTLCRTGKRFE